MSPRPCRKRRIRGRPKSEYFKPAGIPLQEIQEITLSLEEFEALRLVDKERRDQSEAAQKMDISQPTFSRMLTSARQKVAQALIEGKAIKINERN